MCFAFFTQGKEKEKKTTKAILEKSLVMEKKNRVALTSLVIAGFKRDYKKEVHDCEKEINMM